MWGGGTCPPTSEINKWTSYVFMESGKHMRFRYRGRVSTFPFPLRTPIHNMKLYTDDVFFSSLWLSVLQLICKSTNLLLWRYNCRKSSRESSIKLWFLNFLFFDGFLAALVGSPRSSFKTIASIICSGQSKVKTSAETIIILRILKKAT